MTPISEKRKRRRQADEITLVLRRDEIGLAIFDSEQQHPGDLRLSLLEKLREAEKFDA